VKRKQITTHIIDNNIIPLYIKTLLKEANKSSSNVPVEQVTENYSYRMIRS